MIKSDAEVKRSRVRLAGSYIFHSRQEVGSELPAISDLDESGNITSRERALSRY
jgi:hypothetical protein